MAIVDFDFWGNYKYNGSVGRPGGGSVNLTEALPGNGTRPVTSVTINVPSWCTQAKANWLMGDVSFCCLNLAIRLIDENLQPAWSVCLGS